MFGSGFTTTYLLNNAHNQPDIVRWIITNVGNFVGPHVAVWNTFFALIQVAIGLGLLFRQTVRPALALSFFWAFGVWFFGEGLGQIFTGSASALTGAPGSVFLYGLIGLMAWPRSAPAEEDEETEPSVGIASSAVGQGIGGAITPLLVWCGYWSWRRSCSCCRTTEPPRRSRAPSRACRRANRACTPTLSTASVTISAVAASGPRGCWPSAR